MRIESDWYPGQIPRNVSIAANAYIDSSYSFAEFGALHPRALVVGEASGIYNRSTIITGPAARVDIGQYTILNETYLICDERITIGSHCMLSWGVFVTDRWLPGESPVESRRQAMMDVVRDPMRRMPAVGAAAPVVIEDHVWVGFDAVILPGVTLGRGCIVAAKCVVSTDVPAYAVVAGNPARVVRVLEQDDDESARMQAISMHSLRGNAR